MRLAAIIFSVIALVAVLIAETAARPPNIVLILADDLV